MVFDAVKRAGEIVVPTRWLSLSVATLLLLITVSIPSSVLMATGTSTPEPNDGPPPCTLGGAGTGGGAGPGGSGSGPGGNGGGSGSPGGSAGAGVGGGRPRTFPRFGGGGGRSSGGYYAIDYGGRGGLGGYGGISGYNGSSGGSCTNVCTTGTCPDPNKCEDGPISTPESSGDPVIYWEGSVAEKAVDLSISGPDFGWAMERTYNSKLTGGTRLGNRWMGGETDMRFSYDIVPYLVLNSNSRIDLLDSGATTLSLKSHTTIGTSTHSVVVDKTRNSWLYFLDGKLKERSTLQWESQSKTGFQYSYTGVNLTQITTPEGQDYTIDFTYNGSLITKVEIKNGSGTVLQRAEYTYYDDVTTPSTDLGSSGDLVQVKVSQRATKDTGATLSIVRYTQYRYDSDSKLKAVYEHDAIQRIIDNVSGISTPADILTKADSYGTPQVNGFSNRSFTYYTSNQGTDAINTPFATSEDLESAYGAANVAENGMVKSETIGGCSSCGTGGIGITKNYFYMKLDQGASPDQNEVVYVVVEDTVDADDTAVYRTVFGLNSTGRKLRKVFIEDPVGSPRYWCQSWTMDDSGKAHRIKERRFPSAHDVTTASEVRSFLDPYDDSTSSWSNDTNTLRASDGLIDVFGYNSAGSRSSTKVKKGRTGTEYYIWAGDYGDGDGDSTGQDHSDGMLLVAEYSFPTQTTSLANGKKFEYGYTFWDSDDREPKTITVTLPAVPSGQNGSGVATTMTGYYDNRGRLRWTQDGEGYINYYSYNPVTGGEAYVAIDVDPSSPGTDVTSGSSGNWEAWTVGDANSNKPTRSGSLPTALNLVTKTHYDNQGRFDRRADPGGAEHYVAYENLRTLAFPYWDSSTSKTLMPIQISKLNDAGQSDQSIAVKAGYTSVSTSSGAPTGFSSEPGQGDYVRWTRLNRNATHGRVESVDRYHDIPTSGDGTLSTNYYRTVTQYDAIGRPEYTIQVVSGSSASDRKEQVIQSVYDVRGRVIETKMGVSGDSASNSHNMTDDYDTYPALRTIRKTEYDDDSVGDGYVTKVKRYHGTGANDYTGMNYKRTYRGHTRGIEAFYMNGTTETPFGPDTVSDVDWLGRATAIALYATAPTWSTVLTGDGYTAFADATSTDRRTLEKTYFDDLGRVYQTRRYKIAASTGTGSDYLLAGSYYDRNGNLVAVAPAYAAAAEMAYDGAGRNYQTRVVLGLESTKYSSEAFQYRAPVPKPALSSMSGGDDWVLTLDHTAYDGEDAIEQHHFEDNHDDAVSATRGIDLTNNDDYARRSIYSWYDDANRLVAVADYGSGDTTAGAGTWKYAAVPTRPSTAPTASSDTKLLTLYSYDADTGEQDLVTHPVGFETKTFFDDLGRTTYVADNYDDFNASAEANTGDSTDKSKDRVTKFTYNGLSGSVTLVALDANADGNLSDNQTTTYLFEDAVNAALKTNEIYPDSSDTASSGSDQVKFQYNVDGSLNNRTDQRGTVIDYTYTNERRLEMYKVTTLGGNTDGHVRSIGRNYDDIGRVEQIASYANADGTGTVRNEIQYEYDDFGRVTTSYQSHEGAVNTGTSLKVQYAYDATVSSNVFTRQHRLESVTYPDGRVLFYDYDSSNADYPASRMARIDAIRETNGSGAVLSEYKYNGTGMLATADLPEPDVMLDYFQGTTGTYAGYDRFGRIKDQYWDGYNSTPDVDRFRYAHDYNGNRIYRDIDASIYATNNRDQAYAYDGLNRLKNSDEGMLSGTIISGTPAQEEDWALDALGNWSGYITQTSGSTDLDQTRTENAVNEITNITETTGLSWATPTYDAAGNMTSIPQPGNLAGTFAATYDAWNRIVKLEDGVNTIAEYEYDGENRRIVKIDKTGMSDVKYDYYLNGDWQTLEVRKDGDPDPYEQYVWHPYYIDAALLRDYDADVDGSSVRYYYSHDANLNVTAVMGNNGSVVERYGYTPYGELSVLDADFSTDADGVSDVGNAVTYTGRRFDPESGLYQYRHRYYHSQAGKFLSRDPIGYHGGLNQYAYVDGRVTAFLDPFGLEKRRKWGNDEERRKALCEALNNSDNLRDFVDKYDPTFGGTNGYDLFNLEYDTPGYGNVDVDWMITLLAAHYGRSHWFLEGADPGTIYDIGKRWWIVQDWWSDPNVDLDWSRLNQANELAAINAARDLIEGEITLYELFGLSPEDCECEGDSADSDLSDREKERRRNERDRRNRRRRNSRGRRN